jgi:hypothetical protein
VTVTCSSCLSARHVHCGRNGCVCNVCYSLNRGRVRGAAPRPRTPRRVVRVGPRVRTARVYRWPNGRPAVVAEMPELVVELLNLLREEMVA